MLLVNRRLGKKRVNGTKTYAEYYLKRYSPNKSNKKQCNREQEKNMLNELEKEKRIHSFEEISNSIEQALKQEAVVNPS